MVNGVEKGAKIRKGASGVLTCHCSTEDTINRIKWLSIKFERNQLTALSISAYILKGHCTVCKTQWVVYSVQCGCTTHVAGRALSMAHNRLCCSYCISPSSLITVNQAHLHGYLQTVLSEKFCSKWAKEVSWFHSLFTVNIVPGHESVYSKINCHSKSLLREKITILKGAKKICEQSLTHSYYFAFLLHILSHCLPNLLLLFSSLL